MTAANNTERIAPAFFLSCNDAELREAVQKNTAAGYFAADCDPAVFYDKCAQHRAVQALAPELAFDGMQLASLAELPTDCARPLVVRPAFSPQSKGSALIVGGPDRPSTRQAEHQLRHLSGPFQVHTYEQGQPVFINGVFSAGKFIVSDAWRCICLPVGCREILTAVINIPIHQLPDSLVPQLATLAAGMGMVLGPLHTELVLTDNGARLVKLTPRLASSPLPALCQFGGWRSQQQCWQGEPGRLGVAQPADYVADYSFILLRAGRIKAFYFDREVRALASFSHYFAEPAIGQSVQMTVDGDTYGCTVFLRHRSLEVLENDIATLTSLNMSGAFEIE